MAVVAENYEKIVKMRQYMKDHPSIYTYFDGLNYEKSYKQVDYEAKSLAIVNGEINTISDCYIIYAIAVLGCADIQTIARFLQVYRKRNPELFIPELSKDSLKNRLNALKKHGFLFNIQYVIPAVEGSEDNKTEAKCSLYTAGKDAVSIMNSRLRKQVKPNNWIEVKPVDELIGIAASSAVLARIAESEAFKKFETGIFRGRNSGTTWLDGEFVSEIDNQRYYVAIMSLYLHKHPEYATEEDQKELVNYKLNTIRDYLRTRTQKGIAKVILVSENNDDMVRFSRSLMSTGAFDEDMLKNVHFTTYSLVDGYGTNAGDWFLNLVPDASANKGYSYEISERFV